MTHSKPFLARVDAQQKLLIATVSEIRESVEAIAVAESLRPRLAGFLTWQFQEKERSLIQSFLDAKVAFSSITAPSNLLTLYGVFENYIRKLVAAFVDTIAEELPRKRIPENLVIENVFRAGQLLASIKQPLDHLPIDFVRIGNSLTTLDSRSDSDHKAQLEAVAFSANHAVLNANGLSDLLKRVGFDINWDVFGRSEELKSVFNQPRVRDRSNATKSYLDQIARSRNILAHTGGHDGNITTEDILMYCDFLIAFQNVLTHSLADNVPDS